MSVISSDEHLDKLHRELNEKQYLVEGGRINIFRRAREVAKGVRKDKFPPDERKWLEENGSKIIDKITLFRRPVKSAVDKVFNLITLGKWGSLKNKYGFDTFFHLGMVCEYEGGKKVLIDKTGVLNIKPVSSLPSGGGEEYLEVPINNRVSFNHMIHGAKRILGEDRFYRYDSFKANCQMFVMALLKAIGADSNSVREFVFQDIGELVSEMPKYANQVANTITNIAGMADVAMRGEGFTRDRVILNTRGNHSHLYHQDYRKVNTYLLPKDQREPLRAL